MDKGGELEDAQYRYDMQDEETGEPCANPDCGKLVEREGEFCDRCHKEAVEEEKADRIRKGEF